MTKKQHQQILDAIGDVRTDMANMAVNVHAQFHRVDERLGTLERKADEHYDGMVGHLHLIYGEVTGCLGDIETRCGACATISSGGRSA